MVKIVKPEGAPVSTLESLAGFAEDLERETAQGMGDGSEKEPEEAPRATSAQLIGGAIAAGRTVFCIVTKLESPKLILNDAAAQKLGAAWGPVLDKHGIDLNAYVGDFALEISAAFATVEIAMALRTAVQDEIRAKAAKPVQGETVQSEANGD